MLRWLRVGGRKWKCPDLHLVHVETIGGSGKPGTAESVGPHGNAKVSLERYRQVWTHMMLAWHVTGSTPLVDFVCVCMCALLSEFFPSITTTEQRKSNGPLITTT